MNPQKPLPVVKAQHIHHRGASQIALVFRYDVAVKEHLMRFEGMRWSRTRKCFYISDSPGNLERFLRHCHEHFIVDTSGLDERMSEKSYRNPLRNKSRGRKHERTLSAHNARAIERFRVFMEQRRYSESTVKTYVSMLKKFFGAMGERRWDAVTMADITRCNHNEFIEKDKSYSTQNQSINALKLFYAYHDHGHVIPDEIERPRRERKLPEVLTPAEVRRLLDTVQNLKHNTLLSLLYSSGLRIGEALRLELIDIRYEEGLLYIRASKGRKDRRVPLSERMAEQIRRYLRQPYPPKRYLFEGQRRGRPYAYRSAQQIMKRAVEASGVNPRATLHSLRHSYATHLHRSGTDIRYIQVIMGHASVKTTMIYTHVSANDILNIRSPFDDL